MDAYVWMDVCIYVCVYLCTQLLIYQPFLPSKQDYASPETRKIGQVVIHRESQNMSPNAQKAFQRKNKQMLEEGKRDLYF